jgi:hypothetical protein
MIITEGTPSCPAGAIAIRTGKTSINGYLLYALPERSPEVIAVGMKAPVCMPRIPAHFSTFTTFFNVTYQT